MDDAYRSLQSGKIEMNESNATTIADGLRTNLGDINFPIIQEHVEEIIKVEEHEIIAALKLIWERMKIIVEPSSAVALAAVLKRKDLFANAKTGLIISGGNVDFKSITGYL
jgi:threonine dehydratase